MEKVSMFLKSTGLAFWSVLVFLTLVATTSLGLISIGPVFWLFCFVGGAFCSIEAQISKEIGYKNPALLSTVFFLVMGKAVNVYLWDVADIFHIADAIIGLIVFVIAWRRAYA